MRRLLWMVIAAVTVAGGLTVPPTAPAEAVQIAQAGVVSDDPANFTPNVLDGRVQSVTQVGNWILLGGLFTQVRAAGSTTVLARRNMLAFNATTGAISTTFVPEPDGEVTTILPSGDGSTVYVGGYFNNIGAGPSATLARISATTGARVSGFRPASFNGRIRDLRLAGGRLWLAGYFTTVAGQAQTALATVNPTTGAFDPYMRLPIAGVHNGGVTTVLKMDVNPAATRLAAVGNFTTVAGVARRQVFMLDLTGASAAVANWQTGFYTSTCAPAFNTYMRDLDISPDGRYVVVSTTGGYGGPATACDTTARFEVGSTGSGLVPTWIDYTGGDTTYAVAVTGTAVYTGGHARWQNNPSSSNTPGPGAVSRPGIAALDPVNGLPLSWNPTRDRGVGVFDLLATSTGLWVGSDTDRIGPTSEFRAKIAFFPLAGGTTIRSTAPPVLPNDVYIAGSRTVPAPADALSRRSFNGTIAGANTAVPSGGRAWNRVRGAFMLNGQLYTSWDNGTFTRQTFTGTAYGIPVEVNTADQLAVLTEWHTDAANATGMFFLGGRIYFTRAGSTALSYRYFTPESGVVGASRFVASNGVTGINFAAVESMFLAGDKLYWSSLDGLLRRIDFVGGVPVAGTATVVSTPGVNWRARALFLAEGPPAPPPNQPPAAVASVTCNQLTCAWDASGSSDADGTVTDYTWDFGDGSTGTGVRTSHSYAAAGTYTVTLRVTDNGGTVGSTTRVVNPSLSSVTFVGAARVNANATSFTVTVPTTVRQGDALLLFLTGNDTAPTLSAPSGTGWSLVASQNGTNIVGLAWRKVATAADAGRAVTITSTGILKADVTLLAYRGTSATEPVASGAVVTETVSRADHTTPVLTAAGSGGWLISYWADRSSATTTSWATPATVTSRGGSVGTGGGHITSLSGDSGGPVPAGPAGGITATAEVASTRAMMSSVLLVPAA